MKRFSPEEKAMWIEDWKQSGKSVWIYAKENGLCQQTLVNWIKSKRETKTEIKQSLVEVPKQLFQTTHNDPEILIEKGNMRIHIPLEPVLNELHVVIAKIGQEV